MHLISGASVCVKIVSDLTLGLLNGGPQWPNTRDFCLSAHAALFSRTDFHSKYLARSVANKTAPSLGNQSAAFVDRRSAIFALPASEEHDREEAAKEIVDSPRPDYVEYAELIAIHPEMASATSIAIETDHDDRLAVSSHFLKARPSASLERVLSGAGVRERAPFGRKMLLTLYNQNLDNYRLARTKTSIRNVLPPETVAVWQGQAFECYCFVASGACYSILQTLIGRLNCFEVADYLLVQPTDMITKDASRISLLEDWMSDRWKSAATTNPLGHKSARFGRRE